jgi:curved DNA-binding protein CbpA
MKKYYQILGISEQATLDDAKKAYRKLAMKYHPDRNPGNKNCEEQFKTVKDAFEKLEIHFQKIANINELPPEVKKAYEQARQNQPNFWQNGNQNNTRQKKAESQNQSNVHQPNGTQHSHARNEQQKNPYQDNKDNSTKNTNTNTDSKRNFWQKAYDEKLRQEHARNQEQFKTQRQSEAKTDNHQTKTQSHAQAQENKSNTNSNTNTNNAQKKSEKQSQSYGNHEFRLKLLLNEDIFFHNYSSSILKQLNALEDAGFENEESHKQLFHELYLVLKNRKSDTPWLEILALCRYLAKMIHAYGWHSDAMKINEQQVQRLALLTLRQVFSLYINDYHLIVREADYQKLSFIIEDSDEKMTAEMLHHFFTQPVKHPDFQMQLGTFVEQIKIQVFYKHGYPARKVDYLKMLSLHQEKQVLTGYIEQLASQNKHLHEELLSEIRRGMVSFSAIVCLDNMPLHYTINRMNEMIAKQADTTGSIHHVLEHYPLFSVRNNKLALNLDNDTIRTPDALEKLLEEKGCVIKPWQAHESKTESTEDNQVHDETDNHPEHDNIPSSWTTRKLASSQKWLLRYFWMLQPTFLYL